MIEIKTVKNEKDGLKHIEYWKAIPKRMIKNPVPTDVIYISDNDIPAGFFANYMNYFLDGKYLRKLIKVIPILK